MKQISLILVALLLVGGLAACSQTPSAAESAPEPAQTDASISEAGEDADAPESTARSGSPIAFTTTDLDGNAVDVGIFADYPVTMINIWGTYCPPCLVEMPYLGELAEEYANRVQIIGLVIDIQDQRHQIDAGQLELAQAIIEETGADYLHVIYTQEILEGILRGVSAIPTSYFVDSEGYLLALPHVGMESKDSWSKIFEEMLEKTGEV